MQVLSRNKVEPPRPWLLGSAEMGKATRHLSLEVAQEMVEGVLGSVCPSLEKKAIEAQQ